MLRRGGLTKTHPPHDREGGPPPVVGSTATFRLPSGNSVPDDQRSIRVLWLPEALQAQQRYSHQSMSIVVRQALTTPSSVADSAIEDGVFSSPETDERLLVACPWEGCAMSTKVFLAGA